MRNSLLLILLSAALLSCKKNQLGGNAEISGKVAHHGKAIGNATVYIKFKAREFPGADSSVYDAHVKADASGNYMFKCYKGEYYLYAIGIDFLPDQKRVVGGVPVRVRSKEKVIAEVPVSED